MRSLRTALGSWSLNFSVAEAAATAKFKFPFSTGKQQLLESDGCSSTAPRAPGKRHQLFCWEKKATNPFFFQSGWSKGSSETVFLELNVYLNMQMTLFHCYKVNIRFQMEALYLVEFCLQKWTGNTRTIYIGNEITTLRCHQNSRDQCSNTHTHTYTNKKVLDIVMLK